MTNKVNFRYKVMSFGLKNVGTTYQCLIDRVFHELLGDIMEVYIDNKRNINLGDY